MAPPARRSPVPRRRQCLVFQIFRCPGNETRRTHVPAAPAPSLNARRRSLPSTSVHSQEYWRHCLAHRAPVPLPDSLNQRAPHSRRHGAWRIHGEILPKPTADFGRTPPHWTPQCVASEPCTNDTRHTRCASPHRRFRNTARNDFARRPQI